MSVVPRICQAHTFQRTLGHEGVASELALHVLDRGRPDAWDANHTSRMRARTPAQIDALLAEVERVFAHCAHRLFMCDPGTPPELIARLVIEGYAPQPPEVQLVRGTDAVRDGGHGLRSDVAFVPVDDVGTWHRLTVLVRMAYAEGRSAFMEVPNRVIDNLIAGHRKKAPSYRFFLAVLNGHDHGFGAAAACPNRVGVIGDLFTRPEYRRRGIASALIAHLSAQLRDNGAHELMLGAMPNTDALRLSQSLGFVPTCLTQRYLRQRS